MNLWLRNLSRDCWRSKKFDRFQDLRGVQGLHETSLWDYSDGFVWKLRGCSSLHLTIILVMLYQSLIVYWSILFVLCCWRSSGFREPICVMILVINRLCRTWWESLFSGLGFLSISPFKARVAFVLLSFALTLQYIQFSLNHFSADTYVGPPTWFEKQTSGTIDISCLTYMDWSFGGLQFQLEHHLFPRLPECQLRSISRTV